MKKKPANITINLIPKDPFFQTPIGVFLQWALSAGRYIVIFTELIVIVSFAARFTLDRRLTDLNSAIVDQKNVISAYGALEENFRAAQSKLETVEKIDDEVNITSVFESLTLVTPQDVILDQLSISPSTVIISGSTISQNSFNLLINNLQLSQRFYNISISKVESGETSSGFTFTISANTRRIERQSSSTPAEPEKVNILDRDGGGI